MRREKPLHQVGAVVRTKAPAQIVDVLFDGMDRNAQLTGDSLVGPAIAKEPRHLTRAWRQTADC